MNSSENSDFYLERVGFELKVNLRRSLKMGKNVIGRSNMKDVDIGVDSMHCSKRHCVITVNDASIILEDLGAVNSTTVNQKKVIRETLEVKQGDIIGIVGGMNELSNMVGNYNYTVYRLMKYGNTNLPTFEIDDDDPIVLSDEDDSVICLSDSDEEIGPDEERDLDIHLSRFFNQEIKKELADIDEHEKSIKQEPCDSLQEYCIDDGLNDIEPNDWHEPMSFDDVPRGSSNVGNDCDSNDSNDSNRTLFFPPTLIQSNVEPNVSPNNIEVQSNVDPNVSPKNIENESLSYDQGESSNSDHVDKDNLAQKLRETVTKIGISAKRKEGPKVIDAKRLEKRRKVTKTEITPQNSKLKIEIKNDTKKKLKDISPPKPKISVENKPKTQTKAKVKFTPNNRGHFLIDMAQLPILPRESKTKSKKKVITISELSTVTPVELEQQIVKSMTDIVSMFPNGNGHLSLSKVVNGNFSVNNATADELDMEVDANDDFGYTCDTDLIQICQDENADSFVDPKYDEDSAEFDENDDEEDEDDDEESLLNIIMSMEPETGTVRIIETQVIPVECKSILKRTGLPRKVDIPKRRVTFKESGFQSDPLHQIISKLTSYDPLQYKSVDAFCSSMDTNISSFEDTYKDYLEYRRTLVSLMMVELWKEIELEYKNSEVQPFITVTVNDRNLEKRGDGRRMIFHCQDASLYKSMSLSDGHLVLARCDHDDINVEFIGLVTKLEYSKKLAKQKLVFFEMETAGLTEILPIKFLEIRPITVITNTLNSFNAIYNLKSSPLVDLILNPLTAQLQSQYTIENINYKGYDTLDNNQLRILNTLYKRCIKLNVPNISLLDGAAGTGKSHMIVNLVLQLVYGDDLPKPLRILICSKSNGSIDEIATKLMHIRDKTNAQQRIQLARFGFLEHMNAAIRKVSVQCLKETEQYNPQFSNYRNLINQKEILELKIRALSLDDDTDHTADLQVSEKQLFKINSLLDRFEGLDESKLHDGATFILNSCDIICTTLGSISKLQNYVRKVDVCIIDEATQCNEALTILPFRFGMSSLVLVGDSQLIPPTAYSPIAREKNYGNSLFARFQKLYLGKLGSPVFEMNFQYRLHEEILKWPNYQFYKSRVVPHELVKDNSFPIMPYKVISYTLDKGSMETDSIMVIVKFLLERVDSNKHTIGVISTNFKQNSVMQNKLKDHPYITTSSAESYLPEKDIIIIWISKEHGLYHLAHQQRLKTAITRAKKCLLICGADLIAYKNRPVWKSLLENALGRKCLHRFRALTTLKLTNILKKE